MICHLPLVLPHRPNLNNADLFCCSHLIEYIFLMCFFGQVTDDGGHMTAAISHVTIEASPGGGGTDEYPVTGGQGDCLLMEVPEELGSKGTCPPTPPTRHSPPPTQEPLHGVSRAAGGCKMASITGNLLDGIGRHSGPGPRGAVKGLPGVR